MHAPVLLGLGSNLGDRQRNLERALEALEPRAIAVLERSSFYLTEPVGGPPQDWFVNAAARVETTLAPEDLLRACLAVEQGMGRVRGERNGPRTLDIDILFYGRLVLETPGLRLPHPRLHERRFVLVPLLELAPQLRHPVLDLSVAELLERCPDPSQVRKLQPLGARA
jgi:2-amino-4-hydroxy-6-hydroxymethyldihydropteridine diphosphokinase